MSVETQLIECLRVKVYLVVAAGATAPSVTVLKTDTDNVIGESVVEFHLPLGTIASLPKEDTNAP